MLSRVRSAVCAAVARGAPLWQGHESIRLASTKLAQPKATKGLFDGKPREWTKHIYKAAFLPELGYCDRSKGHICLSSCNYLALAEHAGLNQIEGEFIKEHGHISVNRSDQ